MAETGAMQTGLFNVGTATYYADAAGHILTGMQNIGGSTYYFDPLTGGQMSFGFVFDGINTYFFGPDGTLQKGLFTDGKSIYYSDMNGKLLTGLVNVSGLNFYFDPLQGGALMVGGTATDALGHVYVSDATGLAIMIQ